MYLHISIRYQFSIIPLPKLFLIAGRKIADGKGSNRSKLFCPWKSIQHLSKLKHWKNYLLEFPGLVTFFSFFPPSCNLIWTFFERCCIYIKISVKMFCDVNASIWIFALIQYIHFTDPFFKKSVTNYCVLFSFLYQNIIIFCK